MHFFKLKNVYISMYYHYFDCLPLDDSSISWTSILDRDVLDIKSGTESTELLLNHYYGYTLSKYVREINRPPYKKKNNPDHSMHILNTSQSTQTGHSDTSSTCSWDWMVVRRKDVPVLCRQWHSTETSKESGLIRRGLSIVKFCGDL